jgi:hypothetical protein
MGLRGYLRQVGFPSRAETSDGCSESGGWVSDCLPNRNCVHDMTTLSQSIPL